MTSSRQYVSSHQGGFRSWKCSTLCLEQGNCLSTQNYNSTAEMAPGATLPNSALQKGTGLAGPETPSRRAGLTSPS